MAESSKKGLRVKPFLGSMRLMLFSCFDKQFQHLDGAVADHRSGTEHGCHASVEEELVEEDVDFFLAVDDGLAGALGNGIFDDAEGVEGEVGVDGDGVVGVPIDLGGHVGDVDAAGGEAGQRQDEDCGVGAFHCWVACVDELTCYRVDMLICWMLICCEPDKLFNG